MKIGFRKILKNKKNTGLIFLAISSCALTCSFLPTSTNTQFNDKMANGINSLTLKSSEQYRPARRKNGFIASWSLKAVDQYQTVNRFRVAPNLAKRNTSRSRREVLCQLKVRVPLGTIRAGHGPFSGEDWENVFPTESLAETLGPLNACAVVMSSGAMRNSTLGMEIDGHDAVLRFNAAPTEGYSLDVGTKTTLRLVNSKLMMSETDGFLTDPLYSTGVLMVWDPAPYSRDLYAWYRKPDFDFFQTYKDYRRLHPQQPFYILSPSMQWDLWDVIQENTPIDIQPNPPSSGMLGIAVMMNLCEKISVYEFLPSHRKTDLCHYFQNIHDWHCTLGYYHPLIFEKKLVSRLNLGSQNDIQAYGKVMLYGFSQYNCSASTLSGLVITQEMFLLIALMATLFMITVVVIILSFTSLFKKNVELTKNGTTKKAKNYKYLQSSGNSKAGFSKHSQSKSKLTSISS